MRFAVLAATLGAATLVLAACGADVPTPTPAPAAATPTPAPTSTPTPTSPPAAVTPTPTAIPTATAAPGPTATPTPTAAPTSTPAPTPTPTSALPATPTPTPTTPVATPTPTPLAPGGPVTLTLTAVADASIWQGAGTTASGGGSHLYVGTNNGGQPRRVLMRFDLSSVPAGSTITAASVGVTVNKVPPGSNPPTFALHRLSASWGEGTSDSGSRGGRGTSATTDDATWTKRFTGGDSWASQGGDYAATASAQTTGQAWDSNATLVADVQAWVDDPTANFGWIIIETTDEDKSVRRLSSRETSQGPSLNITYLAN